MDIETQIRQIRIVGVITAGFGLLTALAAYPPLNGFIVFLADLLVWPMDGAQTGTDSTARLLMAIGGGIFTAFGVMWMVCGDVFRAAPREMHRLLLVGTIVWFVTDSAASVLADAAMNVVGNVGFMLLLLWPLRKGPQLLKNGQ